MRFPFNHKQFVRIIIKEVEKKKNISILSQLHLWTPQFMKICDIIYEHPIDWHSFHFFHLHHAHRNYASYRNYASFFPYCNSNRGSYKSFSQMCLSETVQYWLFQMRVRKTGASALKERPLMTSDFRVDRGVQNELKKVEIIGKNCRTWKVGWSKIIENCQRSFMEVLLQYILDLSHCKLTGLEILMRQAAFPGDVLLYYV